MHVCMCVYLHMYMYLCRYVCIHIIPSCATFALRRSAPMLPCSPAAALGASAQARSLGRHHPAGSVGQTAAEALAQLVP